MVDCLSPTSSPVYRENCHEDAPVKGVKDECVLTRLTRAGKTGQSDRCHRPGVLGEKWEAVATGAQKAGKRT